MEPIMSTVLVLLIDVLKAFLVAMGTFAAYWVAKKFQMDSIAPELEKNLNDAIINAIEKAKLDVENPNTPTKNINVQTDIIEESLKTIKNISPKFIKSMKLTDNELENKIKSIINSTDKFESIKHLVDDIYKR